MAPLKVKRKAFEKVFDETEMAATLCLEQLCKTGWTSTTVTRKIYYERVSWYGHTPHDCRMAIADLVSGERVLIWITDSEDGPWHTPRATIYKGRYARQLYHHSSVPPVWVRDRDTDSIESILDGQVGKRRFNNFLKRLQYSPKTYKTRLIKKKNFYFDQPGSGTLNKDAEWTGSVLVFSVPDTTLHQECLEISNWHPYPNMTNDPLAIALLGASHEIYGLRMNLHSIEIALDRGANQEKVKNIVFRILNEFRL